MPLSVLETALYVDDLDRAEAFYRDVLGFDVFARAAGRHLFFKCDGHMLLLFRAAETAKPPTNPALPVPPHGARGPGHVCFRASRDGIEHWRRRLESMGIAIEADFVWPSGGRSIYFRDPAGNSLEFAEPCIWGFS